VSIPQRLLADNKGLDWGDGLRDETLECRGHGLRHGANESDGISGSLLADAVNHKKGERHSHVHVR